MESRYDPMETLGAILSALGLAGIIVTEGRVLGFGLLVIVFGIVIWKMGEVRRELRGEIESLRREMEACPGESGSGEDARALEG
ncbi:hypothetical protein [Thermococcus sp. MV11]|uniref:hypothetical protein n=1 Tax=Thermococcus sp. MV11 TaxID=1638267 RepID=UPI00142F3DDA|nr:hypothetical protein [Thermococcus sp. MV11]NJE02618.1 hypothetical protein [Thermococcus sp. MV11]